MNTIDLIFMESGMLQTMDEVFTMDFTEEVSLYNGIKFIETMIGKLIIKMQEYLKKLKTDVGIMIGKYQRKKDFRSLETRLKSSIRENPKIEVEFSNIVQATLIYSKELPKFEKEIERIIKKNYTTYNKSAAMNLDKIINNFLEKLDDFDDKIDFALNETIKKKGLEALKYLEDIRKGRDNTYKYYENMIRSYERFKIEAESKLKSKQLESSSGLDMYKKKCSALSKLSTKMSKITRKIVIKTAFFLA